MNDSTLMVIVVQAMIKLIACIAVAFVTYLTIRKACRTKTAPPVSIWVGLIFCYASALWWTVLEPVYRKPESPNQQMNRERIRDADKRTPSPLSPPDKPVETLQERSARMILESRNQNEAAKQEFKQKP